MYKAFFQFSGAHSDQDIIPDTYGGGAVPALILNNANNSTKKFTLMSPAGVEFDVQVAAGDSKLVEISTKRIVSLLAGCSVVVLTQ
tara:strand:+ start:272 stop:529 length:258 start_codon:yes stop_codon:yes gene_type:complete